jgi:hypothetical protein
MTRTLTGLYDSYEDAEATVRDLEALGIDDDDISLLANKSGVLQRNDVQAGTEAATGLEAGATFGAIVGGATGLLAGLGVLAIPGIGPVVAAGWLVATAAGAAGGAIAGGAGGGLIGAMVSNGVTEEDAHIYAEAVRRGGCVVTARVSDRDVPAAEAILLKYRQVDARMRGQTYRDAGWTGFDTNAPAYTEAEVIRDRESRIPPTRTVYTEAEVVRDREAGAVPSRPPYTEAEVIRERQTRPPPPL